MSQETTPKIGAAKPVRVELRHVQLAAAAQAWTVGDDGLFLALDPPPPVRTLLALQPDGGQRVAAVVTRVAEVEGSHPLRRIGCEVRIVEEAALERFSLVGTEHHEAGQLPVQSTPEDAASDGVAVPAPVVEPEPSEPLDTAEVRALEGAPDATDEDGEPSEAAR